MKSLAERVWKIKNLWFGVDRELAVSNNPPTPQLPLVIHQKSDISDRELVLFSLPEFYGLAVPWRGRKRAPDREKKVIPTTKHAQPQERASSRDAS